MKPSGSPPTCTIGVPTHPGRRRALTTSFARGRSPRNTSPRTTALPTSRRSYWNASPCTTGLAGDRSLEATLLRDADGLDFLGAVGVLRDFSKNPRDLRLAYEQVKKRRVAVPPMLHLDRSKAIAEKRVREMDALLEQLEADSFGCF